MRIAEVADGPWISSGFADTRGALDLERFCGYMGGFANTGPAGVVGKIPILNIFLYFSREVCIMSDSQSLSNTNTNVQRVCIMKNRDGSYLIFNGGAGSGSRIVATGLGEAMAAAYRLNG